MDSSSGRDSDKLSHKLVDIVKLYTHTHTHIHIHTHIYTYTHIHQNVDIVKVHLLSNSTLDNEH